MEEPATHMYQSAPPPEPSCLLLCPTMSSNTLGVAAAKRSQDWQHRKPFYCRVEALIGRGEITSAALGSQHTLFLDSKGAVFSCGENKEGQCGCGTSIAVLAKQRREEWDIGANIGRIATNLSSNSVGMDGHGNSSEHHASQKSQHSAWFSGQALKPFIDRGARQAEVEEASRYIFSMHLLTQTDQVESNMLVTSCTASI